MKILKFCLIATLFTAMTACSSDSEDVTIPDSRSETEEGVNPGIAHFESVMSSELWTTAYHWDKIEALDFSDELLKSLTTAQLVECCGLYPFWGDYIYCGDFNFPAQAKFILTRFNGFNALKNRSDYAGYLIDAYEKVCIEAAAETLDGEVDKGFVWSNKHYVKKCYDYMLLSEDYPDVFRGENGVRLRKLIEEYISISYFEVFGPMQQYLLEVADRYAE